MSTPIVLPDINMCIIFFVADIHLLIPIKNSRVVAATDRQLGELTH